MQAKTSRREAILAAGVALTLAAPSSALAFLGFGDDVQKVYTEDTVRGGIGRIFWGGARCSVLSTRPRTLSPL